jgi:hypothetical protein
MFSSLDRRMLGTAWGTGQTGPLLAHRSSAMASRRMGTIISKNPIPLTTVSSILWALPPSQRQKGHGRPEELRAWSYGGEERRSPAPWLPSQTYRSLVPEPSAKRCPAVRWCTTGLQGPGEISTLRFALKFFLYNRILSEWAMPYRTSDLCRVKAKLARSLWFATIRFSRSLAQ